MAAAAPITVNCAETVDVTRVIRCVLHHQMRRQDQRRGIAHGQHGARHQAGFTSGVALERAVQIGALT